VSDERNPYGYAAPGYWEWEAKKAGYSSVQTYLEAQRRATPRCPHCGTPAGFAFGTGDCGCEADSDAWN
jgi:hypothetical protein